MKEVISKWLAYRHARKIFKKKLAAATIMRDYWINEYRAYAKIYRKSFVYGEIAALSSIQRENQQKIDYYEAEIQRLIKESI